LRSTRTPTLRSRLAWALLILLTALAPVALVGAEGAAPGAPLALSPGLATLDGVASGPAGITLAAAALPAPPMLGQFPRFGTALSAPARFSPPVTRLRLSYAAAVPPGAAALVDVRGSLDGHTWLPWVTDLRSDAVVAFPRPIVAAQYRVTLLGGAGVSPSLRAVALATTGRAPTATSHAPGPFSIAPTFRIRATRQGMAGGRTANGWTIPPRARFVSLPSRSVLSSRGGDEYQVRVSYRGRSAVVPVYDVGPYSHRDDYWDEPRDGFPQLDRGWPQDHAAFYEGFNRGQADKGFVRYPTAMDVGDGVWLDDLGISGDQAEVEVTYLWMGQDPAAGRPSRDPAAPEQVADELGGDFWHSAPLGSSPVGCGAGRHAYWAQAVGDPAAAPVARWQPNLPAEAAYDVFVHVPACPARRAPAQVRYLIQHRDGAVEVAVNQSAQTGWVALGRFPFKAGADGFVQLGAVGDGATVWFDQVKWVRVP
jgi:hypothetical protein